MSRVENKTKRWQCDAMLSINLTIYTYTVYIKIKKYNKIYAYTHIRINKNNHLSLMRFFESKKLENETGKKIVGIELGEWRVEERSAFVPRARARTQKLGEKGNGAKLLRIVHASGKRAANRIDPFLSRKKQNRSHFCQDSLRRDSLSERSYALTLPLDLTILRECHFSVDGNDRRKQNFSPLVIPRGICRDTILFGR